MTTGALHLRPGAREWYMQWLQAEYPALVPKYRRLYRSPRGEFATYAGRGYKQWLGQRAASARRRHGFVERAGPAWRGRESPEIRPSAPAAHRAEELPGLEIAAPGGQPSLF